MIDSALICVISLFLDQLLGEPRRFHPLVGFGMCANYVQRRLNRPDNAFNQLSGSVAVLILIVPVVLFVYYFQQIDEQVCWLIGIICLYLSVGWKSLNQHAEVIVSALSANDINEARKKLSYIVSRDTQSLNKRSITRATIESVIENSNDSIFAPVFWFLVAGAPGVVCYRLINTLDAMWGYKNDQFRSFGWMAAKSDDVVNWLPSRLTVLGFSLLSGSIAVFTRAFQQGKLCGSPNAGPVMAAGALYLKVKIGGDASYHGKNMTKPVLGSDNEVETNDIGRAISLVNKSVMIWLIVIVSLAIIIEMYS